MIVSNYERNGIAEEIMMKTNTTLSVGSTRLLYFHSVNIMRAEIMTITEPKASPSKWRNTP
jgi:hypothetical protein